MYLPSTQVCPSLLPLNTPALGLQACGFDKDGLESSDGLSDPVQGCIYGLLGSGFQLENLDLYDDCTVTHPKFKLLKLETM